MVQVPRQRVPGISSWRTVVKIILVTPEKEEIELGDWKKELVDAIHDVYGEAPPAQVLKVHPAKERKSGFLAGVSKTKKKAKK